MKTAAAQCSTASAAHRAISASEALRAPTGTWTDTGLAGGSVGVSTTVPSASHGGGCGSGSLVAGWVIGGLWRVCWSTPCRRSSASVRERMVNGCGNLLRRPAQGDQQAGQARSLLCASTVPSSFVQ